MSMNPARTLGSALPAGVWTAIWIYFLAPPCLPCFWPANSIRAGAARIAIFCAKFHHHNDKRCIFRCNYGAIHNEQ